MNQEQAEEIEALVAIFGEAMEVIDGHTFDVTIEPFPGEENEVKLRLRIAYSQSYPSELPFYSFKAVAGITQEELEPLVDYVKVVMLKDLGSPMVFDIIEGVKDWLQSRIQEAEVQAQVVVPVVPRHATYTPVTAESFQEWRQRFIQEQNARQASEQEAIRNKVFINGLTYGEVWAKATGRQMFEKANWSKFDVTEDTAAEEESKEEDQEDYEEPLDIPGLEPDSDD